MWVTFGGAWYASLYTGTLSVLQAPSQLHMLFFCGICQLELCLNAAVGAVVCSVAPQIQCFSYRVSLYERMLL